MNRLLGRLLRWGLGELDSRIFLSELDEPYRQLLVTKGSKRAKIWHRKEIVRAVWLSIFARLRERPESTGSRKRTSRRPAFVVAVVGEFLSDIRFGMRSLRRRPLFTAFSVGTLGLGIGASTAIFSVVEAVILRPLPYEDPGQLVQVGDFSGLD